MRAPNNPRPAELDLDDGVESATAADAIDVRFEVPFTHRLRFTQDVLGPADAPVLIDLLHGGPGEAPARAIVVVEAEVDRAGQVGERIRRWMLDAAGRVDLRDVLIVPGGEAIKNDPAQLKRVLSAIESGHLDRRSYVIAIGGGALLDAAGLATGLAHRGLRLIRLPTTTMGQADSGVAVKNAINYFGKKNWLGSLAVPWAVINDRALLASLPDRDWRAGFTEAVKVSLLKDAAFFDRLCADADALTRRDWAAADRALRRSAYWHLMHITRGGDPFETRQARPLDFGHWSAHRLEALSDFRLRHGEAVGIGIAIDCLYSTLAHGLPAASTDRVIACLNGLGVPLHDPHLADPDALLAGLEEFREHLGGQLTVTMLRAIGQPIDVHTIDLSLMRQAIQQLRSQRP